MNEIIINFALVVVASVYCGVLIGKRSLRKEIDKAVGKTLEKVREKEQVLAAELHGELGKVRESIIASARAYQNAVRAVETKLTPPAAYSLGDFAIEKLPEALETGRSLEFKDDSPASTEDETPDGAFTLGDSSRKPADVSEFRAAMSRSAGIGASSENEVSARRATFDLQDIGTEEPTLSAEGASSESGYAAEGLAAPVEDESVVDTLSRRAALQDGNDSAEISDVPAQVDGHSANHGTAAPQIRLVG